MVPDLDAGLSADLSPEIADADLASTADQAGGRREDEDTAAVMKRRWPRLTVDLPVHVRLTTQGPTRIVSCEGRGTDISVGGLAVNADIDLPVGVQVGVEFTLPYSDQPMNFRCFVRNRDGNSYGVEFITENDDDYRKSGELQAGLAAINAQNR
ncbi:MAG: PilZ domain-containing protein [Terriglobales bacterium]|jgi:hypothetical protein